MRIVFDLDGTLCNNTKGNYSLAVPNLKRISKVNELFESGNHITIFTARGMGRTGGDVLKVKSMFEDLTRKQLTDWGVKFHDLILGKPSADIYIDDKGESDVNFFKE